MRLLRLHDTRLWLTALAGLLLCQGAFAAMLEPRSRSQVASVGDTVTFDIVYDSRRSYYVYGAYDVAFDPQRLELVAFENFSNELDGFFPGPAKTDGRLIFLYAYSIFAIQNGPIATVTFRVLRPGVTTVRLEATDDYQGQWSTGGPGSSPQPEFRDAVLATTGMPFPLLRPSHRWDLRGVVVGTTRTLTIPLYNDGTGPLFVESNELVPFSGFYSAEGFDIARDECAGRTVEAGASCDIDIAFTSDTLLARREARAIVKTASSDLLLPELETTVRAVIASPEIVIPRTEILDARQIAPFDRRSVSIVNAGTWPTTVDRLELRFGSFHADAFKIVGDGCSAQYLAAGQSCAVEVEFRPYEEGKFDAVLDVYYSDGLFAATGPILGYTPTGLPVVDPGGPGRFSMTLGDQEERVLTVRNESRTPLAIGGNVQVGDSTGFTVLENDCPHATLEFGETCRVTVRIRPLYVGRHHWSEWLQCDSYYRPSILFNIDVYGVEPR